MTLVMLSTTYTRVPWQAVIVEVEVYTQDGRQRKRKKVVDFKWDKPDGTPNSAEGLYIERIG